MLDKCSITLGDVTIENNTNRASKVWLLIAYLICNRERVVLQEELIYQLWKNGGNDAPGGALKTTLWRARQLLEKLGAVEWVQYTGNGYKWNTEIPVEADFEQFEMRCNAADMAEDTGAKREGYRAALALYRCDFLEQFSAEAWVSPLTAYYNNLYIQTVLKQLPLLQGEEYAEETVQLCRAAVQLSPYQEEIYQYLMRALMAQQEFTEANAVYEEMRELLFSNLGVMPSGESQEIHAQIFQNLNCRFITADVLREQLQEKDPAPGPIFCEFSVFRQFYQAEARSMDRRGDAIHVGLLSVTEQGDKEMQQTKLERVMEQLYMQLRAGLRRGDVVSRCSVSQYAILLQANYENSNKVCERLVRSFAAENPRARVRIQWTVLSLEPLKLPGKSRKRTNRGKNSAGTRQKRTDDKNA